MGRAVKPNHPGYYGPSQTALLFLDYQNVLFAMIPDEGARQLVIGSAKQMLTAARQSNATIIHCLIDTQRDPLPTSKVYEQWFETHKPALHSMPELNSRAQVCFANKEVLPILNQLGVKSLVIGGIATSGAVTGTASQGIDEGFVTTVVRDAVWDPNQQVNQDLLDVLLPISGYVVSTEEAIGYLSKH